MVLRRAIALLTMASYREFGDDSDKVKCGTTYHFTQNGNVTVETCDFVKNLRSTKQTRVDIPKVDPSWVKPWQFHRSRLWCAAGLTRQQKLPDRFCLTDGSVAVRMRICFYYKAWKN